MERDARLPFTPRLQPRTAPTRLHRRSVLGGLAALLGSATGCGYLRAEYARQESLQRSIDAYTIAQPLPAAWKRVPEINGMDNLWQGALYSWQETATPPYDMRTSSHTEESQQGAEHVTTVTWFRCVGEEVSGGCRVSFYAHTHTHRVQNGVPPQDTDSEDRRHDLELAFIRLYDPAAADRIARDGERAAQAAR